MRSVRAHASETALMEIIVAIEDTWQKVMRVGHNPGLTVLTDTIGDGAISNIPTRRPGEKSGNCTEKLSALSIPKSTFAEF
jgi:phosphohistidine phosphatase SixA